MTLTHEEVILALTYGYPGVEWSYDGDGSSLGPVTESDTLVSRGLEWHDKKTPPPTLKDLQKLLGEAQLAQARDGKQQEIRAALAATDHWVVKAAENGATLAKEKKTYRDALRDLHAQAASSSDPSSLTLPALPA